MQPVKWIVGLSILSLASVGASLARAAKASFVVENDVKWTSLGRNENDSMPIGNGDLAANVWTEQNGDLVLLVAKSDAWAELGKLDKLGRLRIQLSPNPFAGSREFAQVLHLEDGSVELTSGRNTVLVWADANHPALHIEVKLEHPATVKAKLEVWRTSAHPYDQPSPDRGGLFEFGNHPVPLSFGADTVLPPSANRLIWYHYNTTSIYPLILEQEHLQTLSVKYPDPILHRCFGAELLGPHLVAEDNHTLRSASPSKELRLDLVALTEQDLASPASWESDLNGLAQQVESLPRKAAWEASRQWWKQFWERSWIHVTGDAQAQEVSQGYIMQRYMMAASSRGKYPVKFNGGLFTVGHDMPADRDSTPSDHNPDFRQWGNSYWNQNTRLLYWPLVATGDYDLLQPWFDMYRNALPLSQDRMQGYFHQPGASLPETMYFWGLPNLNDFGWSNPTDGMKSDWQRYHVQGTLEVISQMLDEYDVTRDAAFARHDIVPFAAAILAYYDDHWPRGADGKIRMYPTQSLETYQNDVLNPTPDIAGLKSVLPRLLALAPGLTSPEQRSAWQKMLQDLPAIPMGRTAHGRTPPLGKGDVDGTPVILPAESYGKTRNGENTELYTVFPYQIYGVGKPGLTLARNTFVARRFPQDTCWGQDGPQAAVLGLTATAQKAAIDEFTDFGDERFKWFWKAGHDWIPDLDNGGTGMLTLELMLMQTDGKRIELLPAWPKQWTADFKLHAPYKTIVEGHVENGKVTHLKVTPKEREKDIVMASGDRM